MNSVSVFCFALLVSHFMCQFLQSILTIRAECDPISWILETGKELERSCDFAMALKYYFAGRMFFARLKLSQQLHSLPDAWKQKFHRYENEFKVLYDGLLPMTNAQASFTAFAFHSMSHPHLSPTILLPQAYASARESVHYQNVVLKRGTMNK